MTQGCHGLKNRGIPRRSNTKCDLSSMPTNKKMLRLTRVALSMALAMSAADGGQLEDLGVPVHKACQRFPEDN